MRYNAGSASQFWLVPLESPDGYETGIIEHAGLMCKIIHSLLLLSEIWFSYLQVWGPLLFMYSSLRSDPPACGSAVLSCYALETLQIIGIKTHD